MITHDFTLVNADTDSIAFCKKDQSHFTEEEQYNLINEINSLLPENIKFSHDGYFKKIIVLKAKNYVLDDGKKVKYKGSSLKSPSLEPALREFIHKIVEAILKDRSNFAEIYLEYVREIADLKDIKRWASRKTISDKTLNSERTNESKIRDAIEDSEYVEGDRLYVYFKSDDSLGLVEKFDGDYNKSKLLEKLHKTGKRFETVLQYKELFPNFSLKRAQKQLEEILK